MAEEIKAMFVFEILGRPPGHIKETLSQLIDKLGELPGIKINNKKIHEPKPVEKEGAENLFTSFAEVEILSEDINSIITLIFHGMPSHVEIIEPDELKFKNFDLGSLLSALTIKLHRYDEIAKTLAMERNILMNKLKELKGEIKIEDIVKIKPKEKDKTKKEKKKAGKKSKKTKK